MRTITAISEEIRDELLQTGRLVPRLYIQYVGSGEELVRFSLSSFPKLDKANAYFQQLGRQKRKGNPDDRLCRLCYVSKAIMLRGEVAIEAVVIVVLDIDMQKLDFQQSSLLSRVVRRGDAIRALISMDDVGVAFVNHLLVFFLRGFLGEQRFRECASALATILVGQSERQA